MDVLIPRNELKEEVIEEIVSPLNKSNIKEVIERKIDGYLENIFPMSIIDSFLGDSVKERFNRFNKMDGDLNNFLIYNKRIFKFIEDSKKIIKDSLLIKEDTFYNLAEFDVKKTILNLGRVSSIYRIINYALKNIILTENIFKEIDENLISFGFSKTYKYTFDDFNKKNKKIALLNMRRRELLSSLNNTPINSSQFFNRLEFEIEEHDGYFLVKEEFEILIRKYDLIEKGFNFGLIDKIATFIPIDYVKQIEIDSFKIILRTFKDNFKIPIALKLNNINLNGKFNVYPLSILDYIEKRPFSQAKFQRVFSNFKRFNKSISEHSSVFAEPKFSTVFRNKFEEATFKIAYIELKNYLEKNFSSATITFNLEEKETEIYSEELNIISFEQYHKLTNEKQRNKIAKNNTLVSFCRYLEEVLKIQDFKTVLSVRKDLFIGKGIKKGSKCLLVNFEKNSSLDSTVANNKNYSYNKFVFVMFKDDIFNYVSEKTIKFINALQITEEKRVFLKENSKKLLFLRIEDFSIEQIDNELNDLDYAKEFLRRFKITIDKNKSSFYLNEKDSLFEIGTPAFNESRDFTSLIIKDLSKQLSINNKKFLLNYVYHLKGKEIKFNDNLNLIDKNKV